MEDAPEANNGHAKAEVSKAGWRKSITRQMPRVAAVGGAIAAVVVAGWVLIGDLKPDEAVVGTLVGLAALALLVSAFASAEWLAALLSRVRGVTVAGFGIQLDAFQKVADQTSGTQSDDEPANATTLLDLKVSLENKLTYLANNIVNADRGSDPIVGFVTIGSLKKNDGLLDADQAQVAYEILGMPQHDYERLTLQSREVFFNGASALVNSLRIIVFANLSRKRLVSRRWKQQQVPEEPRDIVIRSTHPGDPTVHHIVPVIAKKKTTFVYESATKRLESTPRTAGPGGRRFIVVPPTFAEKQDAQLLSVTAGDEIADEIWSVTLYALLQWLGPAPTG